MDNHIGDVNKMVQGPSDSESLWESIVKMGEVLERKSRTPIEDFVTIRNPEPTDTKCVQ